MSDPIRLSLPPDRAALLELRAGDQVLLSGPVFAARDATHELLLAELESGGELPYGLAGHVLFYAGPTPPAAGRPVGSVGPTTARRMDASTPRLLRAGIAGTIGKGPRSTEIRSACAENGAVYFAALGGVAALLARRVVAVDPVAYPELGTEALVRMTLDEFPVVVAIDACGGDLYAHAADEWSR
jgi:fumarate hydratase subunit beta